MRALAIVVLLDRFPVLTETFVVNELLALRRAGHDVRVEALERGDGEPPVSTRYRDRGTVRDLSLIHI